MTPGERLAMGECPECGGEYERLASHWTHPGVDCEAPALDDAQRDVVEGLLLAGGTVAGNGPNSYVEIGTTNDALAEWTASELGWLCQSVRETHSDDPDREPVHRVRTVAHAGLNLYEQWERQPDSEGRRPPAGYLLRPGVGRVWWAYAGGLEWAGPYDSQRRGAFSAVYDDRAEWMQRLLEDAGFDTARVDRGVRLEPRVLDAWLEWIGSAVPGAEYKWASSLVEYHTPRPEGTGLPAVAAECISRAAAEHGEPLSTAAYHSWARGREVLSLEELHAIGGDTSWTDMCEQAGVEAAERGRRQWTGEKTPEVVQRAVQAAAAEVGEPLTQLSYETWRQQRPGEWPSYTAMRESEANPYGSWTDVCEAAGVEAGSVPKGTWTRDRVVEQLRAAYHEVGEPFTTTQYQEFRRESAGSYPAMKAVYGQFESWESVREAVGASD